MHFVHVAISGCCCFLRTAAILTRAQIGRVPIPPVMLGVRYLVVMAVLSCFVEELGKGCDVHGLAFLPLAAREPLLDFLKLPTVPVRILKRGKRVVGTTFRVPPGDTRVLHGVVERAGSVVEDLTDVNPAGDQVVTR